MWDELLNPMIVTIFAREVLEGAIIIGEYRTIIMRSRHWVDKEEEQKAALRAVTVAAIVAAAFAVVLCAMIAIPLAILSQSFDDTTAKVIEGASKLVASICIMQISLKVPTWLGLYAKKSGRPEDDANFLVGLNTRSIQFNVAWNIWREVAECGVFLIPFFLGEDTKAIPLSALVGTVVSLILGLAIYYANQKLKNKFWLAFFMSSLLFMMSVGLFTGAMHLFETVWGVTPTVWTIKGDFWSQNKLPMTIFKPFGYSSSRTVLQMVSFWSAFFLGLALHYRKYRNRRLRRKMSMSSTTSHPVVEDSEDSWCEGQERDPEVEVQKDGEVVLTEHRLIDSAYTEGAETSV